MFNAQDILQQNPGYALCIKGIKLNSIEVVPSSNFEKQYLKICEWGKGVYYLESYIKTPKTWSQTFAQIYWF